MTERPTPERINEAANEYTLKRYLNSSLWNYRTDLNEVFTAGATWHDLTQSKEIEELRGYVGKLREAILGLRPNKFSCWCGHTHEMKIGHRPWCQSAREVLALEMPGEVIK